MAGGFPHCGRQRGFTLVEVLIAMAITAFVAAAAYSGLSSVLSGAEQLRVAAERTRELNQALALINRDMRQFVDRGVIDEFGELRPALSGGPLALYPLMLTRSGWHNSLQQPRSDLQRVFYYVEEGALWRAYYPVLDRAIDTERQALRLLSDVDGIELRFLDNIAGLELRRDLSVDTRDWQQNWIADPADPRAGVLPPVALELRLTLADLGELRSFHVLPAK